MEKIYYKATNRQYMLFFISLSLLVIALTTTDIIWLAVLVLIAINTCMLHFNFFIDTRNCNWLNRADFVLQIFLLVVCLVKFLILTNN